MRTRIVAAFVAGGLLVGAAFLSAAISTPGTAQAQDETEEPASRGPVSRIFGFLREVLDDLVGDGTITQEQADTIVEAAENKAGELLEEHRALHAQLSGFLEDGVITEDEASQLPDDHWLFNEALVEAWEDGELSAEDLRSLPPLHRGHAFGHAFRQGLRFGTLLDDGGFDQEEHNGLPDDHLLKQTDGSEYLEDGSITSDEFREIFSDLRGTFGKDA